MINYEFYKCVVYNGTDTTMIYQISKLYFQIGLMRHGYLLAEATPCELLENYSSQSLEEVFLHLCQKDDKNENDDVDATEVDPVKSKVGMIIH